MKPENIGRVLGIGLRVAGRVAGERMRGSAGTATNAPATNATAGQTAAGDLVRARNAAQTARRARGGIGRGLAGFLRPFGRVGGILWLEVTGVFFLIFVPVFAWRGMWPARASALHGPEHLKFLVYTGLTLAFLYLGVSSFWRAGKK
jgi:hypothetical protein